MLHWWLIPALAILLVLVWVFYLVVKRQGGSGLRSEGRTVYHNQEEPDPSDE